MLNHATEANYTGEVDKSSCSRGIHESNAGGGSLVLDSIVLNSYWSMAFNKWKSEITREDYCANRTDSNHDLIMDCSRF